MAVLDSVEAVSPVDLTRHGISPAAAVRRNLAVPVLVTGAVRADAGILAEGGPARRRHGRHTAALSGTLDGAEMRTDPVFGLEVPREVPGVDGRLLDPRSTWAESEAHDAGARELVELFRRNFEQFADVDPDVASAGPVLRG